MMRTLLKLLSLFALMGGFYYLHYYTDMGAIKKDSATFVDNAVDDIVVHWDTRIFAAYADPAATAGKDMEELFRGYRTLGKLKDAPECKIQDYASYKYPGTNVVYIGVTYQCDLSFEKGPATAMVTLYRFTNTKVWKIRSFDLYSSFLSRPPAPAAAAPAKAPGS